MKKAKMALAAIAVFAVVGGALAFKTAKINKTLYYTHVGAQPTCTTSPGLTVVQQFPGQASVPTSISPNDFGWYSDDQCQTSVVAYTIAD